MTDRHLEPEVVAAIASGASTGPERAEALAHAERCDACRADLAYVIGFERRRRRRRGALIGGALVSLTLAIAVLPRPGAAPVVPSTVRAGGEEGVPVVPTYLPANGSSVTGDSIGFVWGDVGPDTHYRLQISTSAGAPLLDRAVRDTSTYVAVLPPLQPGETYLWLVDAVLADGGSARSRVWRFAIRE